MNGRRFRLILALVIGPLGAPLMLMLAMHGFRAAMIHFDLIALLLSYGLMTSLVLPWLFLLRKPSKKQPSTLAALVIGFLVGFLFLYLFTLDWFDPPPASVFMCGIYGAAGALTGVIAGWIAFGFRRVADEKNA